MLTVGEFFSDMANWPIWNPEIQQVELHETPKADAIGRIRNTKGAFYQFKTTRVHTGCLLEWQREYEMGTTLVQSYSSTKNAEGSTFTAKLYCEGNSKRLKTQRWFRKLVTDKDGDLSRHPRHTLFSLTISPCIPVKIEEMRKLIYIAFIVFAATLSALARASLNAKPAAFPKEHSPARLVALERQ